MADNITLNSMSGGSIVATREVNSRHVQEQMGGYTTLTFTIANGASLSDAQELMGFGLFAIQMPATWTTANLTFQGSYDNSTFQNIYDSAGNELTYIAAASVCITDLPELAPFRYIKIRSGTSGTPVNQGGSRSLILIAKS